MKEETAEAIHTLCDIILEGGCWDREIQMLVDEGALIAAKAVGEPLALEALELVDRATALPEDFARVEAMAEVDAIKADVRKLAEDCGFGFSDADALIPFDTFAYCPDCRYHMDDHDVRQVSARGTVGVCPVTVPEASAARPVVYDYDYKDGENITLYEGDKEVGQLTGLGAASVQRAHMFAAAPDLLLVAQMFDDIERQHGEATDEHLRMLRAAIAKAEGR